MKEEIEKIIDIKEAIRSFDSKVLNSLPDFLIRLLSRMIYQDEINTSIYKCRHLSGVPFIKCLLKGWNVEVIVRGGENIPDSGRFVFAANHPVGGMDAMAIYSAIYTKFTSVVSPANQLLMKIPNMRSLVFGVDVFGKASREITSKLDQLYESDTQIMIFPAGEVSRRNKGIISDIAWQKSFITKAVRHNRDIIPVHISGRNSNLFYNVAGTRKKLGIKVYLETLMLPREMMKQRSSSVTVTFGKPLPYQTFTSGKTHAEWAQHVKAVVYSLPDKYSMQQ